MDFQKDVIEFSKEVPVLVDFWAEWCGPCRVLGPILDELERKADGRWKLIKVNVDEHRDISAQFHIQGIPAVKLFVDGKEVDGFTGALPEFQIKSWLDKHLPSAMDKAIALLREKADQNPDQAKTEAEVMLEKEDAKNLRLFLSELVLNEDPFRALELIEDFRPGDNDFDKASDLRALAELAMGDFEQDSPAKAFLEIAREAIKNMDEEKLLEALVQAVMLDKSYMDDLPRRACIALFRSKGQNHPLTKKFRPRFDMALY
jgi:putative thioredoxin